MGLNPTILRQDRAFALAVSPSEPPAVPRRGYRASGFVLGGEAAIRLGDAAARGFRAAALSIVNERGLWEPGAIETQFARVEGNAVRRAYARAEFWDERVRMMQ